MSGGIIQFKVDSEQQILKSTPNDRFLRTFLMAILFWHSEFLPEICWEEVAEEIFLHISFMLEAVPYV